MKKCDILNDLFVSEEIVYFMESHNAISAKISENVGFKALWASGLTMSASLGVRDENEVSWTQLIDQLEYMSDASTVPILFDGDTGFGNYNNFIRLVKKLEQRDIAGVVIEDKNFPKTNSFLLSKKQQLADIREHSLKLKAGVEHKINKNFKIFARLESYIIGSDDALERAYEYHKAGADGLVVHSKKNNTEDIEHFVKNFNIETPIIIIPTKYPHIGVDDYNNLGVKGVIFANHNLRASIVAQQQISKYIFDNKSLKDIDKNFKIASVDDIFELQNVKELQRSERMYL